ncbi:hypothetical protein KY289_002179 [Solanum tuberosum]|nr:hypothetical protein KY289_002179 [Solanum tuberosum]
MAIFSFTLLIAFSIAITLTQTSILAEAEVKSGGFSIELIHLASKRSPASLSTELFPEPLGPYLINFSVGTPPKFQLAMTDSKSYMNWIQCEPCVECYSQNLPIFNSLNSSSYKALSCASPKCFQNNCEGSHCTYIAKYADQISYSYGDLGMELFTFYSPQGIEEISFRDILFGCGHRSKVEGIGPKISGMISLSDSRQSLISQIIPSFGKIFSYCFVALAHLDVPSTLRFGENAWGITGSVFTPMLVKESEPSYFLTLLGISIGDKRMDFFGNSSSNMFREGNIAIDIGTAMTVLPTSFYNQIKTAFIQAIDAEPLVYENNSTSQLCYEDLIAVPSVTMHFIAAELPLSKDNIMFPKGQGIWCLAFRPTEGQAYYGNVVQTNFLVGYDLNKMFLSFKPTDCTKLA